MNVYDFDGTIYDGDSSIDFYLFCLKRNRNIVIRLPIQIYAVIKYKIGVMNKTNMKERLFSFMSYLDDPEVMIEEFWDKHYTKVKQWYISRKKKDDVIISASPKFLLLPICKRFGIENVIASDVDIYTGRFNSENCHDKMKVIYFINSFPDAHIDEFYSDSLSDEPMAKMADDAYLVQRSELKRWYPSK